MAGLDRCGPRDCWRVRCTLQLGVNRSKRRAFYRTVEVRGQLAPGAARLEEATRSRRARPVCSQAITLDARVSGTKASAAYYSRKDEGVCRYCC